MFSILQFCVYRTVIKFKNIISPLVDANAQTLTIGKSASWEKSMEKKYGCLKKN